MPPKKNRGRAFATQSFCLEKKQKGFQTNSSIAHAGLSANLAPSIKLVSYLLSLVNYDKANRTI